MKKTVTILRVCAIISVVFPLFYPVNFFSFVFVDEGKQVTSLSEAVIKFLFTYAWFAWVIMAIAWAFQQKLPRFWPISGTITGTIGLLPLVALIFPALSVLPAVLLAILFCNFHLNGKSTTVQSATQSNLDSNPRS